MSHLVRDALRRLNPDPWRAEAGFSSDVSGVHEILWSKGMDAARDAAVLSEWLEVHQICAFGRLAAKNGWLRLCILTESDLNRADERIAARIQADRMAWKREALNGKRTGFLVLAVSRTLACAAPDAALFEFAQKLGSLYLGAPPSPDTVCIDDVHLQIPDEPEFALRWEAPLNFFASQGDGRWWHDRRIPGGIAFSINSVGHMLEAGMLHGSSREESAHIALRMAQRTIDASTDTISGKAATVLPGAPPRYRAAEHTDYTLPSAYFRPERERPVQVASHVLEFTTDFDHPPVIGGGEGWADPENRCRGGGARVHLGISERKNFSP